MLRTIFSATDERRYAQIQHLVFRIFVLEIQIAADVLAMENARDGMGAHAVKL
jgi:hypothetical protein